MNYGFDCRKTFTISMHHISILRRLARLGRAHACLKITAQIALCPGTHHSMRFLAVRNLPSLAQPPRLTLVSLNLYREGKGRFSINRHEKQAPVLLNSNQTG